ncbi:MAG: hypothetical protein ABJM26_12090 [Anderseniella sp.]
MTTNEEVSTVTRPRGKIDQLARECGVEILPCHKARRGRTCKVTHARRTLQRMLRQHGPGHVRLTLRCIVDSSRTNASQLHDDTIGAVSDVLAENPEIADMDGLLDAFENLNLAKIRRAQTKAFRTARRHRIAAILADRLLGEG